MALYGMVDGRSVVYAPISAGQPLPSASSTILTIAADSFIMFILVYLRGEGRGGDEGECGVQMSNNGSANLFP